MMSLVIPVYKNSGNIPPLLAALRELRAKVGEAFEVVFVVDGSPDDSFLQLTNLLPQEPFQSQLLLLSRNFGAFAAIQAGLGAARGERCAVMAADLQEPPELITTFDEVLRSGDYDVAIGVRTSRNDPLSTRVMSALFWGFYRRFVQPEIPEGGVDIFSCTKKVREQILLLRENNSSLVGLLFWVGFRRTQIPYQRKSREVGVSAWTFARKLRYLTDSIYGFSDLPIRLLTRIGSLGLLVSITLGIVVMAGKLFGAIPVPGYAATVLTVVFFGALNCLGLGVIGNYVWRTFENTKVRPNYVVASASSFSAAAFESQKEDS